MFDIKALIKIVEEGKLKNISVYNLSSPENEKYVIISTANSTIQSKKVADMVANYYQYQEKIEGYFKGEWIVFDLETVTLHIFLPKAREKYNLDKLYKPKKIYI